jgi:hypothetical protein
LTLQNYDYVGPSGTNHAYAKLTSPHAPLPALPLLVLRAGTVRATALMASNDSDLNLAIATSCCDLNDRMAFCAIHTRASHKRGFVTRSLHCPAAHGRMCLGRTSRLRSMFLFSNIVNCRHACLHTCVCCVLPSHLDMPCRRPDAVPRARLFHDRRGC